MKINVLGAQIDNIDMAEAVSLVLSFTNEKTCRTVYTPNAEIVMAAVKEASFMTLLNSADLLIPDGAGVVLGAKLLKTPVKEKVAGIDLINSVFSSGKPLSVFLYGSAPGIADTAAESIEKRYPSVNVTGTEHGYHDSSYNAEIIKKINEAGPDILLVALGAPSQENWIYENASQLKSGVAIGCGGALDVLSGNVKRAPDWMIKLNLEWFYRLIKQPKRLGRMMRIPVFLFLCIKKRLTKRN